MPVLVEDSAEAPASSYVAAGDVVRVGDRRGQRVQWAGICDALMRPVGVVEPLELAQGVEQMVLVPDQGAVQQLVPAGLYPAFRERVHARYPDAGARILEDGVELGGSRLLLLRVPAAGVPLEAVLLHQRDGADGSLVAHRSGSHTINDLISEDEAGDDEDWGVDEADWDDEDDNGAPDELIGTRRAVLR
jgi:hypothetical protein